MKEILFFILLISICAGAHGADVSVSTPQGGMDGERDATLAQFYSVLPTYSAEKDYAKFVDRRQRGTVVGTFPGYMEERFLRQKKAGIIMVAVGGALTIGAGVLAAVLASMPKCGSQEDPACYIGAEEGTMLTFSAVFAVSATVLYGVGIPKWVLGKSRAEKMRQFRGTNDARLSGVEGLGLSFIYVPRLGAYGLGAGFRF